MATLPEDEPDGRLIILMNRGVKMSRGKYAAQAVHAALLALGVHPNVPVIVLGAHRVDIEQMRTQVHDAGRTEVAPGTLTAGTDWNAPANITYLGWGGSSKTLSADMDLGLGHLRPMHEYGVRRALWDIAFGYVSGFRLRDIAWYVITRSLHPGITAWVLRREGIKVVDGVAVTTEGIA